MDPNYFSFFAGFLSAFFAFFIVVVLLLSFVAQSCFGSGERGACHPPLGIRIRMRETCVKRNPGKNERHRLFGRFAGEHSLVVALAGEDGQALAAYTHLQGMVVGLALAMGLEGQRVWVAGLLGDAGIEILERLALRAIKHIATGIVGIFLQAVEFPLKVGAADRHTVNRDAL